MTGTTNIGVVILAAGSSSRLGQPKQLLEYENKTLLQRIIDIIIPFEFSPSVVVLGAHADQIRDSTNLDHVTVVFNKHWSEGIASSIRLGVEESLKLNEAIEDILFLLSDQPFVTSGLVRELISKHKSGNQRITASSYKQNVGVPALFSKDFFPHLTELKGDVGAKKIIMQHREDVDEVPFRKGAFDVDTHKDYEQLQDHTS